MNWRNLNFRTKHLTFGKTTRGNAWLEEPASTIECFPSAHTNLSPLNPVHTQACLQEIQHSHLAACYQPLAQLPSTGQKGSPAHKEDAQICGVVLLRQLPRAAQIMYLLLGNTYRAWLYTASRHGRHQVGQPGAVTEWSPKIHFLNRKAWYKRVLFDIIFVKKNRKNNCRKYVQISVWVYIRVLRILCILCTQAISASDYGNWVAGWTIWEEDSLFTV